MHSDRALSRNPQLKHPKIEKLLNQKNRVRSTFLTDDSMPSKV
ncbi:hypothetical protein D1AOALGA4SA_8028 [Olavius algarvensis Delta 1 endosymbiont]|nr:hypothetical protein D1AOALGA4SA_8028 [Olavius algarvensis Delta 1 endosymbiont]